MLRVRQPPSSISLNVDDEAAGYAREQRERARRRDFYDDGGGTYRGRVYALTLVGRRGRGTRGNAAPAGRRQVSAATEDGTGQSPVMDGRLRLELGRFKMPDDDIAGLD
jgi:hypothetical protein